MKKIVASLGVTALVLGGATVVSAQTVRPTMLVFALNGGQTTAPAADAAGQATGAGAAAGADAAGAAGAEAGAAAGAGAGAVGGIGASTLIPIAIGGVVIAGGAIAATSGGNNDSSPS